MLIKVIYIINKLSIIRLFTKFMVNNLVIVIFLLSAKSSISFAM